jgi:hypothetical protein
MVRWILVRICTAAGHWTPSNALIGVFVCLSDVESPLVGHLASQPVVELSYLTVCVSRSASDAPTNVR